MNEHPVDPWLTTVRVEPTLLREGSLLRIDDLSDFAADLVAVLAGTRTRQSALEEFLDAWRFDLAARCALEAGGDERSDLEERLGVAWGAARDPWSDLITAAHETVRRGEHSDPLPPELQRALADVRTECTALEEKIAAWPLWNDASLSERLRAFSPSEAQAIQQQAELLSIAMQDAAQAFERAEQARVDQLKRLKANGDDLVNELALRRDLAPDARGWVGRLAASLAVALAGGDLAQLQTAIEALEGLKRGELPAEAPTPPLAPQRRSVPPPAAGDRIPFDEGALSRLSQMEVIARLEHAPSMSDDAVSIWTDVLREWNPESLESLRRSTRALARLDAIGAQLLLKARAALVAGERERAHQFFLDALRWGLSDNVSTLPLSRYQDGAAWGLLHAITLSSWTEPWNYARFDTESRDMHDVVLRLESLGLFADVAEALLALRHHGVTCFQRWLEPLLVERRSSLRALVAGLADTFPQDPLWLWRLLAALIRTELPSLTVGDDTPLAGAPPKDPRAFRAWRAERLDGLKERLQLLRDQSGLADEALAALEDVAQRLERGARELEAGVSLALLTPEVAAGNESLAVLRLTLNDERRAGIRGLRADVRLDVGGAVRHGQIVVPWLPKNVPVEIATRVSNVEPAAASLAVSLWELAPDGARAQVPTRVSNFTLSFAEPYTPGANPYILKNAVHDASQVFGRTGEIRKVLSTLRGAHQLNPVLVLGARRIGKTSFLNAVCAQREVVEEFAVVRIDFQSVTAAESIEVFFLTRMMRGIQERLQQDGALVPIREQALRESPHAAFASFMDAVENRLHARGRKLLLVIDEIEKVASAARVDDRGRPQSIGEEVLASLRAAMQRSRRVGFLLAGATDGVRRYQRTYHSRLFQLAEEIELPPLDDESARALVERQSAPYLAWRVSAVDVVLRETAGDPSLIQLVCFKVFEALTARRARAVTGFDVRAAIEPIVETSKDFWAFFESLDDAVDRAVVRVIAELQADPLRRERESARDRRWVRRRWIAEELRRRGQPMADDALVERLERLCREVSNVLTRNPSQVQRDFRITAGLFAQHLVARPSRRRAAGPGRAG